MKVGIGATALACLLFPGTRMLRTRSRSASRRRSRAPTRCSASTASRGFNAAVKKYGTKVGGKELEFVIASTDATPDSAVRAVRKLIEQDKVQILLSPLSGDEGIAVKNFSKTHPELTFINAASGAQETTFPDPSPNFFRWNMDGAQWQVGLGDYAYNQKGYRKIATVGEDYSFVYTQVMGLVLDFCGARRPGDRAASGCRSAPRTSPRPSRRCPTTSTRSISASAAPTRSTSSTSISRPAARPICSAARSWSTRPCCRPRATRRRR